MRWASVADTRPARIGLQLGEARLRRGQRREHRAREQPVQQQELGRVPVVERAAVGAQERLPRAAGAQQRQPRRDRCRRRRTCVDSSRAVMSTRSTTAAQHQEQPALVAAHRRVGQPGHDRAPLPHPAEERVHALLLDPAPGVRQAVPGGVEASPTSPTRWSRARRGRSPGPRRARRRPSWRCSRRGRASPTTRAGASGRSGVGTPMTASSDRQASSSSTHGSSSMRWRCTSRMRAVSSARST